MKISFNQPIHLPNTESEVLKVLKGNHLSGMGSYTEKCERWLNKNNKSANLLVNSATSALELMPMLIKLKPGDEVILPSFTFVSTASAFARMGITLRFADVDLNGNILISEVERFLNSKTKAVVTVHYGGNSCDMKKLVSLCESAKVTLLEDAAQAIGAKYNGVALGTIGTLGCYSFHETKNISAGEGGALIINEQKKLINSAEILREKGTNRRNFLNGLTDKYTWVDIGSSYVMSELNAAYLFSQLISFQKIQKRRAELWERYETGFSRSFEKHGFYSIRSPKWNEPNWHMYAIILSSKRDRNSFIDYMRKLKITCPFHYIPLHNSPQGRLLQAQKPEKLKNVDLLSDRLVRLPMYFNLKNDQQNRVIDTALKWFEK